MAFEELLFADVILDQEFDMSPFVYRFTLTVFLLPLLSCGGVSEQRIGALEAQINKMKEASAQGNVGPQIPGLQEQIAAVEKSTSGRAGKMEEMLEVLQREVSRLSSEPDTKTGAVPVPWGDIDAILGVADSGVSETGKNQFTVKREWLFRAVLAMALSGKGPKLAEGKKGGVSVKGVKPSSLPGKLGLKNNDVIRSIGGREVNSPAEISVALRAASSPAEIEIQRKKKDLTLKYTLAD